MRRAQISATYFIVSIVAVLWLFDVQMPEEETAPASKDIMAEKQFMADVNQYQRLGYWLEDHDFQQCAYRRVSSPRRIMVDEGYCNGRQGRFSSNWPINSDSLDEVQREMVRVVDSLANRKGYLRY